MADARSVTVTLSLEVAQAIANAEEFGSAMQDAMGVAEEGSADAGAALEDFGELAGKVAGATGAALGVVGKAAMDWESQFAGVEKTIDGTSEQLAGLEDELREMARTMPATHEEIAATAEAAGQLGVATEDIADFTTTMIQLGETTNITADDAATSIAQFMNVMGTAADEVDEIGNTLVDLGNKGASTEGQILDMAQRVAGAGALIGASEADVLALSSAMANLGIESELGGGAVQRILTGINTQVMAGSEMLDGYAEVAGVSAQRFARVWERDPVRAFDKFIQGLGRAQDSGKDVVSLLDSLGIKGTQNLQVMLRLAGAGDTLTTALEQSGTAWDENSALLDEYAKRAETTESQVTVAWNQIKDSVIDSGESMLPVIATTAEAVGTMADAFGSIPDPVQEAGIQIGLVVTVAGGLLFLGTKAAAAVSALTVQMTAMSGASGAAAVATRGLVAAAGGLIGLVAVGAAIKGIQEATTETLPGLNDLTVRLLQLGEGQVGSLGSEFDSIGESIRRMTDLTAEESFGDFLAGFTDPLTPWDNTAKSLREAEAEINALDEALAGLVSQGHADVAANALTAVGDSSNLTAAQMDQLLGLLPSYNEALAGVEASSILAGNGSKEAASGLEQLLNPLAGTAAGSKDAADGMEDAADAADEAARAAEEFANQVEYLEGVLSGRASWRDYEAAIDDATAALKENGRTLDIQTSKGRANQEALDAIAATALKVAEDLSPLRRARYLENAREEFIDVAEAMGMSQRGAKALADELGLLARAKPTPQADLDTKPFDGKVTRSQRRLADLQSKIVTATIEGDVDGLLGSLGRADRELLGITQKEWKAFVRGDISSLVSAIGNARAELNSLRDKTVTIRTIRVGGGPVTSTGQGQTNNPRAADGGTVPKTGLPYADRHLYLLADGEEIISNRYGQADQFRADRAAGRIPGYADGGTTGDDPKRKGPTKAQLIDRAYGQFDVDIKMGVAGVRSELDDLRAAIKDAKGTWTGAMKEQSRELLKSAREYESLTEDLKRTQEAQKEYRQEVAGSFDNDIFGNGVAGLKTQLEADRNDSRAMLKAIRTAEAKGLDGGLARELFASGDLTTASQIASMSRAEIRQLEKLYGSTNAAQQALGGFAAQDQFGAQIRELEKARREERREFMSELKDFLGGKLPKTLETATYHGARDGIADRNRGTRQRTQTGG